MTRVLTFPLSEGATKVQSAPRNDKSHLSVASLSGDNTSLTTVDRVGIEPTTYYKRDRVGYTGFIGILRARIAKFRDSCSTNYSIFRRKGATKVQPTVEPSFLAPAPQKARQLAGHERATLAHLMFGPSLGLYGLRDWR